MINHNDTYLRVFPLIPFEVDKAKNILIPLLRGGDRSVQWLYCRRQMQGSASWLLPWFLNDGPAHVRDIKRRRHQLYRGPSQHKHWVDQMTKERKKRQERRKPSSHQLCWSQKSSSLSSAHKGSYPLRPTPRPPPKLLTSFWCPSPALFSSPGALNSSIGLWSYLAQ